MLDAVRELRTLIANELQPQSVMRLERATSALVASTPSWMHFSPGSSAGVALAASEKHFYTLIRR
jgi:hypothetical protein